ncbi:DUF4198 domain-containing protein [Azotobacter vinelandii]
MQPSPTTCSISTKFRCGWKASASRRSLDKRLDRERLPSPDRQRLKVKVHSQWQAGGRSPNKLQITAPDGSSVAPENGHVGHYRTTFDVHLTQKGTYKLAMLNNGSLLATWKENGQVRHWKGKREDLAAHVPSLASELKIGQGDSRLETFVTLGQPTETVLKPTNYGLELVPITHPNDLVAGESAEFYFLLDGKPATDLDVIIIPSGQRYRNEANELKFKTDAQGKFSVTWPSAGIYGLHADLTTPEGAVKPATERFASYSATLEVLTP